ncbi:hypothetical protein RCL1_002779 [Eukaryota sp. TZLM3-RCL]
MSDTQRLAFEKSYFQRQQELLERAAKRKESTHHSHIDTILHDLTSSLSSLKTSVQQNVSPEDVEAQLSELESYLASVSSQIPSYHVRRFKGEIQALRKSHCPSTFDVVLTSDSVRLVSEPEKVYLRPGSTRLRGLFFTNLSSSIIFPSRSDIQGQPLVLENLSSCTIKLFSHVASLRVSDLSDSIVIVGPVQSACHLTNCRDCIFVLTSHQVRIHDCVNCKFFVFCPTNPVIENSRDLIFGHVEPRYYSDIEEDVETVALLNTNLYSEVLDFSCPSKPSPNFKIASSEEQDELDLLLSA